MPPAGYTSILSVTDKQYSEIRNYWGKSERARPEMPQQLEFFWYIALWNTKLHPTNFPGVRQDVLCIGVICVTCRIWITAMREVVVWCRIGMRNNAVNFHKRATMLWFDVELEWGTTRRKLRKRRRTLWFDVELEWGTTKSFPRNCRWKLWFDVELEWGTTGMKREDAVIGCGLM